jgi:hypothetical protein|tara:strand:- start:61 stop:204 length:144 start_codon:yes stop_codon:yes gene_type:complete
MRIRDIKIIKNLSVLSLKEKFENFIEKNLNSEIIKIEDKMTINIIEY